MRFFNSILARHLKKPVGIIGKLVALLMNKGNDSMNHYTINLLDIQPGEHILEIGFGNGKYISELVEAT